MWPTPASTTSTRRSAGCTGPSRPRPTARRWKRPWSRRSMTSSGQCGNCSTNERRRLMAAPVVVPRLGWSMEEGTLLEWLKQDGDLVRPGEPLFVLESEKAAEQVEAIDGGILHIAPEVRPGDR